MPTQAWQDRKGNPAEQDHKPTDTLLSSTDTSMELARCCSAPSGRGTWVWESLHCSLSMFILTPYGWLADEPAYSPLGGPQRMPKGKVVKKKKREYCF